MRAPIQAISDGKAPAITVTQPKNTDSRRSVSHTSFSARLVYLKTPKKRWIELGDSAGFTAGAGWLAMPGLPFMWRARLLKNPAEGRQSAIDPCNYPAPTWPV